MNELTRNKKEERLFKVAVVLVGALFIVGLYLLFPQVFAEDDQGNTATIIKLIVKIFKITAIIAGVILIIAGAFKYGMAHANNNGPDEQSARGMIVGGVVLTLLFSLIITDDVVNELISMINKETTTK